MNQGDLVSRLDGFFDVGAFPEADLWTSMLSPSERAVYERLARPEFVAGTWNGLMLDSVPEIDRVYLIVFPDQAVLDTILALELDRSGPGALIFAHHPADFEERSRGFIGLREAQIEELLEHRISYYCCHAPLDCHSEISTVGALAKALKLHDFAPFAPHHGESMEGVHGQISSVPLRAIFFMSDIDMWSGWLWVMNIKSAGFAPLISYGSMYIVLFPAFIMKLA